MNLVCFGLLFMICQPGAPTPARLTIAVCPVIAPWSSDYQRRLAAELRALPAGSAVERAVAEAISLRDQTRACRNPPQG